ncbi:MAG TPA: peptidoglycan recognition family protein [Candidatus Saccharimonadales bacterium]|nr:peptidoglycan recognition family protein [Candidatus Saccharimonadales bacterium]
MRFSKVRRFAGLLGATAAVLVIGILSPVIAAAQSTVTTTRQQLFANAAKEFGVPQEILLGISYNQSRWENHNGKPSASGGYGLMHLTASVEGEDGRGDPTRPLEVRTKSAAVSTLAEAASLIKTNPDELKTDDRQNIRGAAALLASHAKKDNNGQLPKSTADWYGAIAATSGISDAAKAQEFADNVYGTLRAGASLTTTDKQQLRITAQIGLKPDTATLKQDLRLFSQPETNENTPTPECPPTVTCKFAAARFAQNNPENPADYGNYDEANRPQDTKVKYIVIHDTEGSYESSIAWFQDPRSYVAAHYVIRSSDGEITQMVKTKDIGWHAGNWYMNMHSIGVEHEGFAAEGATWYSEAMYRSSAKLVRYLANKYDIPLDREHIVGHEQYHGLTPARAKLMHNDPGPFWDWEHYMDLLHAKPIHAKHHKANAVTIAPKFSNNKQVISQCINGTCKDLPERGSNSVYLRTAPNENAPLLTDAGLHPDGTHGTTEISDWSAVASYGQRFAVAERQGDWVAIWFGGQKGWFRNPDSWRDRTAVATRARLVTPKAGKASVPLYGRPVPEAGVYGNVPPLTPVSLQYNLLAGQSYVAYDGQAINDYYYVSTFDRSNPGDGEIVVGDEKYIPISYNHRQAFVKASDVDITR